MNVEQRQAAADPQTKPPHVACSLLSSITTIAIYYAPRRGHSTMMLSGVCLSVCLSRTYGPKSRTERPRKTKIGTEVAHVTRDSDTIFKVKRSKVKVTGAGVYCGGLPYSLLLLLLLSPKADTHLPSHGG